MRSSSVLILLAPLRSHVLPVLYVAELLADEYDVYFAVANDSLEKLVRQNGFYTVRESPFRALTGMEAQFLREQKNHKPSFVRIAKAYWTQEVARFRQRELDGLIAQLKPAVILIDIFSSTDYLLLFGRYPGIRLLFFNPMLSTYPVAGFPSVSEGHWVLNTARPAAKSLLAVNWKRDWKRPREVVRKLLVDRTCRKLVSQSQVPEADVDLNNPIVYTVKAVPELVLAPLEFEFSPDVQRDWQHYLGLCTHSQRHDTELDSLFKVRWPIILERRQAGGQLVYCSFGTYYTGPDRALMQFIENLLEVVRAMPDVQMICAVNRFVVETIQAQCANVPNAHFFSHVPQLQVLQNADAFITHGGLGSIKEAIEYEVPMLAYPLDPQNDQAGNAFKIESHGLGLRGNFQFERVNDLRTKLTRLLTDDIFRQNLKAFRVNLTNRYTLEQNRSLLRQLLGQSVQKYQFDDALSA